MSIEKETNSKEKRTIKPFNEHFYKCNLSVLPENLQRLIHSKESVLTPVEDNVSIAGLKNPICVIIYGFSTRKVWDAVKRQDLRNDIIFIIEPNIGILKATMEREFVGDILTDPNTELLTDIKDDELQINLYKLMAISSQDKGTRPSKMQAPEIICDPFLKYNESVQKIVQATTAASKQLFTSMGCSSDTFARWENSIRNESNMQKGLQTKPFFGAFKGKPCIVLGGGPSIEDFIKVFKEKKWDDKIIVIACDAILRRLLVEGIKPHFVLRCERKLTTIFEGVTKDATGDIMYLAYPWTPPEYFELFENFSVVTRDNGICNNMGFDIGSLNGGVSAANACFELASVMGCSPILMSGIDLCFIGDKSHVEGTIIEFDVEKSKSLWVDVDNNSGGKSKTIPVWTRCRSEYEAAIFKHKLKNVYNTSKDGVKIAMTEFKELSSFGFERDHHIVDIIKTLKVKVPECNWLIKKKEMVSFLKNCRKDLDKLFSFLNDSMTIGAQEELKSINQLFTVKYTSENFFNNIRALRKSLFTMYSEPLRQIEVLKNKLFSDKKFCELILDTIQIDFFSSENKLVSLDNIYRKDTLEMAKAAIEQNFTIFKLAHKMIDKMIDLFENGAKIPQYDPITEELLMCATVSICSEFELLYSKHRKIADRIGKNYGYL